MIVRIRKRSIALCVWFWLLLLQSPLELCLPVFAYIDEVFGLLGLASAVWMTLSTGKLRLHRMTMHLVAAMGIFLAAGMLGNLYYGYQPWSAVFIDVYTNVKFFLSILSGFYLFQWNPEGLDTLCTHARGASVVLFFLLAWDLVFRSFPSMGIRYGLRVIQLCWRHPTYLAGSMVFLLGILTARYRKGDGKYIAMCLSVLLFTLRGKAIAGAMLYGVIFVVVIHRQKTLKLHHGLLAAFLTVLVSWRQFSYYYLELAGKSARSILTKTAFQIMKDSFPIGTGFGSFGSSQAAKHYSQVYIQYGFLQIPELDGRGTDFFSDTFWPILLGQTGALGTAAYLCALGILAHQVAKTAPQNLRAYGAGVFLLGYLLISTTSEPAFHNSIAVPMAMLLGFLLASERREKQ